MQHVYMSAYNMSVAHLIQEAQLSQRGCAMLRVTEYFAKSLKVIGNSSIRYVAIEFILVFHSNYAPILYRFRYKKRDIGRK